MARVKLFTHTDLDGAGCAVVANHAYGKDNVSVSYCDYGNVDEQVANFITSNKYRNYDLILITDISVKEEVAELIDRHINYTRGVPDGTLSTREAERTLILLDHHATATWLNKYWWATVTPSKHVETKLGKWKTSGTSMLYDYVLYDYIEGNEDVILTIDNDPINLFAETVRRWDTWDWTILKDEFPKSLNNLMYLIGKERFVERFTNNIDITLTETENLLLTIEEENIKRYIDRVSKNVVVRPLRGEGFNFDNVGFVFAEQYISELGNVIASNRLDLDFVVLVNLADCSLSFRGVKDDIDLGAEVAVHFGGGGHPKSAGAKLDKQAVRNIVLQAMFVDIHFGF